MDYAGAKRRADSDMAGGPGKKAKAGGKMSFAEKMMAKMGHVKGEGLGKDGIGIVNPIEVKLRPQGAGVGVVKEMTPQAKAEARRAAERRGETYDNSSDEEREAARQKRKAAKLRKSLGVSTPTPARPRAKIRTAAEIEAEDGLVVPDIFKTLVDHTGAQTKQITSGAGIFTSALTPDTNVNPETEKLVKNARIELEAFAAAWRELQDRRTYLDAREQQAKSEIDVEAARQSRMQRLDALVDEIAALDFSATSSTEQLGNSADALTSKLQHANVDQDQEGMALEMSDIAVAAILPLFKQEMEEWSPLQGGPAGILRHLKKTGLFFSAFEAPPAQPGQDLTLEDDAVDARSRPMPAYDSMVFSFWLPKVRNAIVNDWDAHDPAPALSLLSDWQDVLPAFISRIVVDQLVTPKLMVALRSWRPGKTTRHKHPRPHQWIFPWLEKLDQYQLDPKSAGGLLAEVKRKYRSALESFDPASSTVDDLDEWLAVAPLKTELHKELQVKLLPRLAQYLQSVFEVDPTDQDITPIEAVLKWAKYFSTDKFMRVLLSGFFPKWHGVLYQWLTAEPNYEEVGEWFTWWQSVFPASLNEDPSMEAEWTKGLEMMNKAMELGPEQVKTDLEPPTAEADVSTTAASAACAAPSKASEQQAREQPPQEEAASMRDILEDLCEQENVLLMPLRKAHPDTGLPLLRITASASGAGGAVVYIKGDVVWAQNKRDRGLWEPVDVFSDGALVRLAEAK